MNYGTVPLGPLSRKVYTGRFATKIIPCKLYDCMHKIKVLCANIKQLKKNLSPLSPPHRPTSLF